MSDCIFCKIIEGAVPSAKVFEDEEVIAFLDIMPISKGHTLVVPKQHCETIDKVPDEILAKICAVVKQLAGAVAAGVGAAGGNPLLATGKAAGQEVAQLHFHIIPRHENDGLHFDSNRGKYVDEEMDKYRQKIVLAKKNIR